MRRIFKVQSSKFKVQTLVTVATALLSLGAAAQSNDPMVVSTESGLVRGFDHEGTIGFLGIPYAKVERFMPPMPVDKWDTIRICDHWGPQAMQSTRGRKLTEAEMSEKNSCVLNVWTTATRHSSSSKSNHKLQTSNFKLQTSKLKPVMVWLHGGGFDSGTSAWNPGMQLAKKDVVVVSINHRLNILGFLDLSACDPKYKYSGNVGMLDVVQALQWIQKNIRQFGGDPTNVTVFGESGGGGKVGTLLCMPVAKGLFHKAIIMSGTILNVNTKAMTEELGLAVLKELNIDREHIDKIKDVPYEELYAAGQRAMAASIGTRKPGTPMMWGFGPTPDGEVLLQQPFQDGFADFSKDIPILMGTTFNELQRLCYDRELTEQEARNELAKTFGDETDNYISAFAKAWPDYKPQDLLSIDWLFRPKTIITADAVTSYRSSSLHPSPFKSNHKLQTSNFKLQTPPSPLYMYMFTWRSPVNKGSVHGHELKFCFNTLHHAGSELPKPTEQDLRLADTMSSVWAQFAKTGNPQVDGLPDWQPYTKENGELMVFDHSCYIRNNPDRELEQIIDRHCFKQLDEFRKTHPSPSTLQGNHKLQTSNFKLQSSKLKPRLVVCTDIAPADVEPDDMESMVRLMAYADCFEIEAMITSVGWNCDPYPVEWKEYLMRVIEAYRKDVPKLMTRSEQTAFLSLPQENGRQEIGYWPSADYLKQRAVMGSAKGGIKAIGEGNDSPGSELLIRLADEDDPRPIYVAAWGGANTLAQAIWRVKHTRTDEEVKKFVRKFRIYTITDQDMAYNNRMNRAYSSHQWLRREFADDLQFVWDEGTWQEQCELGKRHWQQHKDNIQGRGALGSEYPTYKWGVEGDTPSFLYVLPNGLSDPDDPTQAGWAGYHERGISPDSLTTAWNSWQEPVRTISVGYKQRFYSDELSDFMARMQWAAEGRGNRNPQVVVNGQEGFAPIVVHERAGQELRLDASNTSDPDGDALTFSWWSEKEHGRGEPAIDGADQPVATVHIPEDAQGKTLHVICEVHDNGHFHLVAYRRIIIKVL